MSASPTPIYEFGEFRLDATKRVLLREGAPVPLTPRVFDTLLYMVEHHDTVLEKNRLMEAVWPDVVVEENNLTQNISTLRRVFGETPGSHRFIVTLPGRGYRFVADVKKCNNGGTSRAPMMAEAGKQTEIFAEPPADLSQPAARRRFFLTVAVVALFCLVAALFSLRNFLRQPFEPSTPSVTETALISDKSIAVLPFENLSDDKENAYFATGVQEEILTRLSKIAALKVISRGSTQKFKSVPDNLRQIAQQLRVAYLLEGSVQKSGDAVRVTVQLIHAQSDTHVWAESYDRKMTDMFQVETDVAERIATALAATLTGSEKRALNARPTANVDAHHAYLRGRHFWNRRTPEGFKKAIDQFNRAIELDPAYAPAYAGLADAILFLSGYDAPEQKEALIKGRAALNKALELDETLAEPHASLGLIAMNIDWDWAEAERQYKRAIELNPNYATAHQWYGEFLAYMGRFDQGITNVQRAQELDPLSLIISTDVAKVYALARRYDEAINQFKRALEMDPDFPEAHALLGMTYSMNGQHDEAANELRNIKSVESNAAYLSWLGYVHGIAGRKDEALAVANQLRDLSSRTYVSPLWMTVLYTGLGERELAFQWLERTFGERALGGAISLKVNPIFDSLRSDPRFTDFLRRANFAPDH